MAALANDTRITATEAEPFGGFLFQQLMGQRMVFTRLGINVLDKLTAEASETCHFCYAYSLSNGGFFMAPGTAEEHMKAVWPDNYFEAEMSFQAVGILACLITLASLWGQTEDDEVGEKYHALFDFAQQHPEAGNILKALD